jgi:hypothetical protein
LSFNFLRSLGWRQAIFSYVDSCFCVHRPGRSWSCCWNHSLLLSGYVHTIVAMPLKLCWWLLPLPSLSHFYNGKVILECDAQ